MNMLAAWSARVYGTQTGTQTQHEGRDMAQKTLTEQMIDRMRPPPADAGRLEIWDKALPGFGLRVSPAGTKTFVLMYRFDGRKRRLTLGNYDSETFKLAHARDAAREALQKVDKKIDPAESLEEGGAGSEGHTVSEALSVYITRQVKPNRRDWEAVERALKLDLEKRLGQRPVASIARSDLFTVIDAIVDRDSPIMANRMVTMLKTFFGWCVERGYIADNPAAGIGRQARESTRERVLDMGELARVWAACEALEYPFGTIARLLMLTAQRRDEVAGMRWSEIDLERATWTLPPERAKNGKEHVVALPPASVAIIKTVPQKGSPLLFTTTGKTVVSGWSRAKERLDWLLMAPGAEIGPPAPIEHWTLHDLRRSAATRMAGLGVAPHVVDRILNHVSGTIRGVAAIYNRHAYLDERQAALELWAEAVMAAVA